MAVSDFNDAEIGTRAQSRDFVNGFVPSVHTRQRVRHSLLGVERRKPTVAPYKGRISMAVQVPSNGVALGILASVPVAWSTYNVAVRQLYSIEVAPPATLLNLGTYIASVVAFFVAFGWKWSLKPKRSARVKQLIPQIGSEAISNFSDWRYYTAAAELGLYLFLGSTAQLEGLKHTSASRGAFIVQTTTIMVPVAEALLGRSTLKKLTVPLILATLGICLFSLEDGGATGELVSFQVNLGDIQTLLAAVFYSLHVLRLGDLCKHLPDSLFLALGQSITQLTYSVVYIALTIPAMGGYTAYFSDLSGDDVKVTAALTLWLGFATTAYPQWAQSYGQRTVSPAIASILYSSQPIWAALLAVPLLGERLSQMEALGGVAIIASSVLAMADTRKEE